MMFRVLERENRRQAAVPLPGPGSFNRRRQLWLAIALLYFAISMSVIPEARPIPGLAAAGLPDLTAVIVSIAGMLLLFHGIYRTHPGRERHWTSNKEINRIG